MKTPSTVSSVLATLYATSPQAAALLGELERKLRADDPFWDDDVIPSLREMALAELGAQYSKYPNLDNLSECDQELVLEKIPLDIPLELAVSTIPDGRFWERLAKSRWSNENYPRPHTNCNLTEHGNSWRRLVLERHLQEHLENIDPVVADVDELKGVFQMCSAHVRRLDIRELKREVPVSLPDTIAEEDPPDTYLADHLNLGLYLPELHHLEDFHLVFTKRYMGDNFKWDDLRVSIKDLEHLGQGLAKIPSLQSLHIHRSQVDDYRLAALLRPLVEIHHTLVHLDLSHCQIGDIGALALAATLLQLPNLRILILTNNRIGPRGAKGIAYALAVQTSQEIGVVGRVSNTPHTESQEIPTGPPKLHSMLENSLMGLHKQIPSTGRVSPIRNRILENTTSGYSVSTARTIKRCSLTSTHSALVRTLDTLDLSLNPIGDQGGMYIASAISRGGGPSIVDLVGCGLGNNAGLHLAEALRFTQLVQAMDLSSNALSESAGIAFVEVLYENVYILQLDLRDSLVVAEDLAKIAESLENNWERRRELWELQTLQERKMSMEQKTGDSDTYRECSDRSSALVSSLKLRETKLLAAPDSLMDIADEVESAFDNLREEDVTGGGDRGHVTRQICERDPELIDDDQIYCRDALDSLVPLNLVDERCQMRNFSHTGAEAQTNGPYGDRGETAAANTSVTLSQSPRFASRTASRTN